MKFRRSVLLLPLALLLVACPSSADDVLRMDVEELRSLLGSPEVTTIDVRFESDWAASKTKIKGAVREDSRKVETWAAKYAKDRPIVLYCA